MPIGKNFSQIKDRIQREARQKIKRDFFKKTKAEYEYEVRREVLKIAGIHHGISDQENFPQSDNKTREEYDREVSGYRDVIKHAYGETSREYATVQ
jgi:N-methylhydantoinase A/oxoprolinase/acetone carboxylase beta subunit